MIFLRDKHNSPEQKFTCSNVSVYITKVNKSKLQLAKFIGQEIIQGCKLRGIMQSKHRLIMDIGCLNKIVSNLLRKTYSE